MKIDHQNQRYAPQKIKLPDATFTADVFHKKYLTKILLKAKLRFKFLCLNLPFSFRIRLLF